MKPRLKIIFIIAILLLAAAASIAAFLVNSNKGPAAPYDKSALKDDALSSPVVNVETTPTEMRNAASPELARRKAKTPVVVKIVDTPNPMNVIVLTDILLAGAETALSLFIIAWAVSFVRKKIEDAMRPTPYELAQKELAAIKTARKKASPQELCARISSMVRSYVNGQFRKGSSELTTAEFLSEFNTIPAASALPRQTMDSLFSLCDLVKFSGYDPSSVELETAIESAKSIITALNKLETERKIKGAP